MQFTRRMLLIGTDTRFSQLVQTHIHKSFLLTTPAARFEDLANLVRRDTDGVLLFLASEPADVDRIEVAVRELRLQQLPPRLAILSAEHFAASRRLDALAPQLDANFVWPGHLREFNGWIRRAVVPGTPFPDWQTESSVQRIRGRLLPLTPSLAPLAEQLEIAAAHDVTVLIEGETGTGKTHLAKLIHDGSRRAAQRFLAVSCGSLPGSLAAEEFFGRAGGPSEAKLGKFEAAGGGTLMIDEIDALGLDQQANLLRVIESGEFEPVGGHDMRRSEARIIASSNGSLADAVGRGTFRNDLYYRLNVLAFRLPPLRERPNDVSPLVRGMVARYNARFSKRIGGIQNEAMRALELFPWPGNIRQLENVVQQAVLVCTGDELRLQHLPLPPIIHTLRSETATPLPAHGPGPAGSLAHNRETTERAAISRALEKVSFSRTRAAELLGVSRVTLYKKMKKYGLFGKPTGSEAPVFARMGGS